MSRRWRDCARRRAIRCWSGRTRSRSTPRDRIRERVASSWWTRKRFCARQEAPVEQLVRSSRCGPAKARGELRTGLMLASARRLRRAAAFPAKRTRTAVIATGPSIWNGVVGKAMGPEVRAQALFRDVHWCRANGAPLTRARSRPSVMRPQAHRRLAARPRQGPIDEALSPLGLEREIVTIVGGFAVAGSGRASTSSPAFPNDIPETCARECTVSASGVHAGDHRVLLWHPRLDADLAHRWLRGLVRDICAASAMRDHYAASSSAAPPPSAPPRATRTRVLQPRSVRQDLPEAPPRACVVEAEHVARDRTQRPPRARCAATYGPSPQHAGTCRRRRVVAKSRQSTAPAPSIVIRRGPASRRRRNSSCSIAGHAVRPP